MDAFQNIKDIERLHGMTREMSSKQYRSKENRLYRRDAQSNQLAKRRYKNLKFNYMFFFLALILIGLFFFMFLLLKDYTQLRNTRDIHRAIDRTISLNKISMKFEELYYTFNELKIRSFDTAYKAHQRLETQRKKYDGLSSEITELLIQIQNEGEIVTFDRDRNLILRGLMHGNLCAQGGFAAAQVRECGGLRGSQLTHGYSPFIVDLMNKFKVDLDSIKAVPPATRRAFVKKMWRTRDSIEISYAMSYFQDVSTILARSFENIIIARIAVIETQSIYFFWTLCLLLTAFYFCLWKQSYRELTEEAIRINKYLMIIPLRLMRNNHNIKVHMMRYLKVNINNITST